MVELLRKCYLFLIVIKTFETSARIPLQIGDSLPAVSLYLCVNFHTCLIGPVQTPNFWAALKHGIGNPETETEYRIREKKFQAIDLKKKC